MSTPDDNQPPQTSKFFDIIPSSKRSSASPNSRPLINQKSPLQSDSMINKDDRLSPIEIPPEKLPEAEHTDDQDSAITNDAVDQTSIEPVAIAEPSEDENTPAPIQTDIEQREQQELQPETAVKGSEPSEDGDTLPPVQTDIEQTSATIEQPGTVKEELLLPAEATPDEVAVPEAVVIHSPETSRSFRLRTWLIALLFVIIIAIIALVLYIFVFKANATITPDSRIFGS